MQLGRRLLLRGQLNRGGNVQRPPWAQPEALFLDRCSRCDACISQCPEQILTRGDGGFPELNFNRSGCSFCARCVSACETGALEKTEEKPPWQLTLSISEQCIALQGVVCVSCAEACQERAIRLPLRAGRVATPQFDAARCSACGYCIAPCPGSAISLNKTPLEESQE